MNDKQKTKCRIIADHYGINNQLQIAIEEMSELTKEICKHNRKFNNTAMLIDEIADVSIMLGQLCYLFCITGQVNTRIDYKLDRQLKRIEEEESE